MRIRSRSRGKPWKPQGSSENYNDPRWWVGIEGGERTYISDLGLDAEPQAVADWIAITAQQQQCAVAVRRPH